MRIIGGELKGRKLHPINGRFIRPTSDRLRESLFSILSDQVTNSVVLDLFAGTGALGIEAISRGAEFAVFLDKYKSALSVLERNIRLCALEGKTKVIQWDIIRNLNCIRSIHCPCKFNLVFMDPPYNKNAMKPVLYNLQRCQCLEHNASVVVEHSILEPVPEDHKAFCIRDQRRYGKTLVSFLQYVV